MAKPLRSEDPNPKSVQFSHFGVLDDGQRSRSAAVTSIVINVSLALVIIILGMVVKTNPTLNKKLVELTLAPEPKPLPKPKIPPPPPPKPLPQPPHIEPPKVVMPKPVPQPPVPKPVEMPQPKPAIQPPAPKRVSPPPAPKVVNLGVKAASIPNRDAHPSPVALGANTAVRPLTGKPVPQPVNLSGGMPGMNAHNTGSGPRATTVNLGSGSPNGNNMNGRDRAAEPVRGLGTGVPGGTGHGRRGPVAVQIAPPMETASTGGRPTEAMRTAQKPPTLIYKPTPVYPAEARAMHLEGNVQCKIRVTASGGVEFLGITRGLGHGLDQSAEQVVHGMRFKPATDAAGRPVDWVGDVVVRFQLS